VNKKQVIEQVRQRESDLRRLGIQSLALFGSWVRDEQNADSDVDLLYRFEEGGATLDHFLAVQALLEDALGRPVDLVSAKYISAHLARRLGGEVEEVIASTESDRPAGHQTSA